MTRVRLSVDVDPDLRRRIKISAAARDETVKDFLERAILRELRQGNGGAARRHDEEEQEFYPSKGGKPQGSKNPPSSRSGRTVADAVIEDRR